MVMERQFISADMFLHYVDQIEDDIVELVEGVIVDMSRPGWEHGEILMSLASPIYDHVRQKDLGRVAVGDTGFLLERREDGKDTVRGLDLAFVRKDRASENLSAGWTTIAPDLAVEVISPGNKAADIHLKISQLLAAGTALIWIVYPDLKMVNIHTQEGAVTLQIGDTLSGGDVLPGLEIPVGRRLSLLIATWRLGSGLQTSSERSAVTTLVQVIWDYMLVGHHLRKADCILVLGSHDIRVADYAIELYRQLVMRLTCCFPAASCSSNAALNVFWDATEAEIFARRALEEGVPAERILIEKQSTNTGENFHYSRQLLKSKGLEFRSFVMVQKPYMERRVLATALKLWPEWDYVVTSPQIPCAEYLNGALPRDAVIQHIVGDFQRIKVYGENGFQAPQEIPAAAWDAFEQLVALGYDERLVEP